MTTAKTTKIANTFKAVSKIRDMDKETSKFIEELCKECIEYPKESKENEKEKFHDEKEIADFIKNKLEEDSKKKGYDYCWHVIVGKNFGGCVTYKEGALDYFYVGQTGFLIFATSEV